MRKHEITYSVVGSVTQEIEIIDESYTMTDIVDGLNDGKLITTLAFGWGHKSYITKIGTASPVAIIIMQTVNGTAEQFSLVGN